ncbi:hypothetical protein LJC07_06200 [Christensenellaceae bacterium OttesenSCG-928-L17]|nr:hypothetical protein [Christensenellaceae bacterium OttesenSCG-928-L17]
MNEFFTWVMLATYAGATAFVALATQALKEWGILKKIPTQLLSYILAAVVLLVATAATDGLTWSSGGLCIVNAVVVSIAANGGFEAVKKVFGKKE